MSGAIHHGNGLEIAGQPWPKGTDCHAGRHGRHHDRRPCCIVAGRFDQSANRGRPGSGRSLAGLATIAGSWIGGGANQTALREVFHPSDTLFSQMVAVDVLVAELWMAALIYGAGMAARIDHLLGADSSQVQRVKEHLDSDQLANEKTPAMRDYIFLAAAGFGATGAAHGLAEIITPYLSENFPALAKYSLTSNFFWVITIATLIGIGLSATPVRKLEYSGASKLGSVFLYVLIATIGMQMDLGAVADNPGLFAIGLIWISIHGIILIIVCKWLKYHFSFWP
jgi:uncharacterized membrane protein